jgi:hypothetical protein
MQDAESVTFAHCYLRPSMHKSSFWLLLSLLLSVGLYQCANPIAPQGGPKDTQPPQIDSARSTPNHSIRFRESKIHLAFDEWIKFEDAQRQVVISPPLVKQPTITLRGRTITFEFDAEEVLKPDATYTINFGSAVKDLNEGNLAKDLRFVFATGDQIDSLSLSGKVVDAFSGKAVPDMLVMLYDNLTDSVVRKERPFYFGRSNQEGIFSIENLRADTFKMFALLDGNLNYLWDQSSEQIAFPEREVELTDTTKPYIELRAFREVPRLKLLDTDEPHFGLVKLVFNQPPTGISLSTNGGADQRLLAEIDGDTLALWYDTPQEHWKIFLQKDTIFFDTVTVKPPVKDDFLAEYPLAPAGQAARPRTKGKAAPAATQAPKSSAPKQVTQNPLQPFSIIWNHPLSMLDTTFVKILEDTSKTPVVARFTMPDSTNRRSLEIRYPWREDASYEIALLPGAVTDFFNLKNDTLRYLLQVLSQKNLGTIVLQLDNPKEEPAFLLELVGQSEQVIKSWRMNRAGAQAFTIPALQVGEYSVRLNEDLNRNGRWDTGNYDLKIQPEKVFLQKLEPLRANWELEVKLSTTVFDKKRRPGE